MNYEALMRQTLVMAICYDMAMAAIQSVGSINTADHKTVHLVVYEALRQAAEEKEEVTHG